MDLKKMNRTDAILGLLIFCISGPFLLIMPQFVTGGASAVTSPLAFPRFVVMLTVILSLVLTVTAIVRPLPPEVEELDPEEARHRKVSILSYITILFLYLALLNYIGFLIATPIIMLMVAWMLGGRNFLTLVPGTIIFSTALYFIALKLMKIMLPGGIFFE